MVSTSVFEESFVGGSDWSFRSEVINELSSPFLEELF